MHLSNYLIIFTIPHIIIFHPIRHPLLKEFQQTKLLLTQNIFAKNISHQALNSGTLVVVAVLVLVVVVAVVAVATE